MIWNSVLGALRSFRSKPVNTAIKLLALSLGLVCLLAAHAIGDYFRQADRQWEKAGRTYVVVQESAGPAGDWNEPPLQAASAPVARYLKSDFPELETVARLFPSVLTMQREGQTVSTTAYAIDPEFLDIFNLVPVAGEMSLARPRTVLLSETSAKILYGDVDPIGQVLSAGNSGGSLDVTVAGVYGDLPADSHLGAAGRMTIQGLTSMATWDDILVANQPGRERLTESENFRLLNFITYVVLPVRGGSTAAEFNRRLEDFVARRIPEGTFGTRLRAIPIGGLSEMRFNQQVGTPFGASIITALYLLGALTLAVGCINFANLSAAEALMRAREIGLRKTVGARRRHIGAQTLVESTILAAAALLLTLPLTGLVVSMITTQFFLPVTLPGLSRVGYWGGVAAIIAGVALVAGVYPAFVLSSLRPVMAMQGNRLNNGTGLPRHLLIGAQFAVAGFLLSLVIVMLTQQAYLTNATLRPGNDPVVVLPFPGVQSPEAQEDRLNTVRQQLLASPAINGFTVRSSPPFFELSGQTSDFATSLDPGARRVSGQARSIYYGYFDVMDIEILAGRGFSSDSNDTSSIVIDAATARAFGFGDPREAVGQRIFRLTAREDTAAAGENPPEFQIIGVVEREPFELTVDGPTNYLYVAQPVIGGQALVRLAKDSVEGGLAHIREVWEQFDQPRPPSPTFLDQAFGQSYRAYSMITGVFMALSAISIAIAAMGLFGLASFIMQRRTREIGVRKTLGATAGRVIAMMLWDFSIPIIVANIVAWPVAFLAARLYLDMFVTRMDLTPVPFLLALAVSLVIAWLAVSAHTLRAARVNPALVLKTE